MLWWLVACRHAEVAPAAAPDSRAQEVAWLPARATTVTRSPPDKTPILLSFRGLVRAACFDELLGELDSVYQIWRDPPEKMGWGHHGGDGAVNPRPS